MKPTNRYGLSPGQVKIFNSLLEADERYLSIEALSQVGNIVYHHVYKAITQIKDKCEGDYIVNHKRGLGYAMTKIKKCCPHCGKEV